MNIQAGDKITIISDKGMTAKDEITVLQFDPVTTLLAYKKGRDRSASKTRISDKLVFMGWNHAALQPDAHEKCKGCRMNACINLIGTPDTLRAYIDTHNINPNARKDNIIAIGNADQEMRFQTETPVYMELAVASTHAVVRNIVDKIA